MKKGLEVLGRTHCRRCLRRKNAILPSTGICRKCTLDVKLARLKPRPR